MTNYFAEPKTANMLTYTRSWDEFTLPDKAKTVIDSGEAHYVGTITKKRFKLNRVVAFVKDDADNDYVITKEVVNNPY